MGMSGAFAIIAILVLFVGLPLVILWLRDRIRRARCRRLDSRENIATGGHSFEERLLRPDWDFYERHLQRPAPAALRELYADTALVMARDLAYTDANSISTFGPLDEQGFLDTRSWLGFDAVAVATTDFGDLIYLRPGPAEGATVYITHHDGGDIEVFAESVAAMVNILRQVNQCS